MIKRTKQKELILKALHSSSFHPTAVYIYDEVRKGLPHISLATVYRNLRLFRDLGEISELPYVGSLSRFDIRTDPHGHFWCDSCDSVTDLVPSLTRDLNIKIGMHNGFEISSYRLVVHGLCPACQPQPKLVPALKAESGDCQ